MYGEPVIGLHRLVTAERTLAFLLQLVGQSVVRIFGGQGLRRLGIRMVAQVHDGQLG